MDKNPDNIFEELVKGDCYKLRLDDYRYDKTKFLFKLTFKIIDKECNVTKSNEQVNTVSNEELQKYSVELLIPKDSTSDYINASYNSSQLDKKPYIVNVKYENEDKTMQFIIENMNDLLTNYCKFIVGEYGNNYPIVIRSIAIEYNTNFESDKKKYDEEKNDKKENSQQPKSYNYKIIEKNSYVKGGIRLPAYEEPYFVFGKFENVSRLTEKEDLNMTDAVKNFFNINNGGALSHKYRRTRKSHKASKKSKKSGRKSQRRTRR